MQRLKPTNEQELIYLFATEALSRDIHLISLQTEFPDALVEVGGERFSVEFEYVASNYSKHKHHPLGCDVVVCYHADVELAIPTIALDDIAWEWEIKEVDMTDIVNRLWKRVLKLEASLLEIEVPPTKENSVCSNCKAAFSSAKALAGHLAHCKQKEQADALD